jgi:chromosome segregation ATPase
MGIILLVSIFIAIATILLMNNMHKKEIKELELIIENFENCFAQKSEKLSNLHDDYWKLESRYTKKVREVELVWDKIRLQECITIDLSKEITKLKEENLQLSEQLFETKLHRDVLQTHLTEVKDNFDSLQREYDILYGENVSLKEDVEHLEDEIEIKSARIHELEESIHNFDEKQSKLYAATLEKFLRTL